MVGSILVHLFDHTNTRRRCLCICISVFLYFCISVFLYFCIHDFFFKNATRPASQILAENGLTPIELSAKEGLARINGTQLITSLGAEAVVRSANVANCADLACALTLEVLEGTTNAFHACIHDVRPHAGQKATAARLRKVRLLFCMCVLAY